MVNITGKRRLIFGLSAVVVVALVEWLVPAGWSMYGHLAIIAVVVSYYGNDASNKKAKAKAEAEAANGQ